MGMLFSLGPILDEWKQSRPGEYAIAMVNAGAGMAGLLERIAEHQSVPGFFKGEIREWANELKQRAELERVAGG